ncbi:hypothetical protein Q3G72_028135 [Acer saccharum]|nr:hypothetical protein Q3G72_028135 [Acer saccharum]
MEIYSSLLCGQIGKTGPVCCAAITQEFCSAPSPNAANKILLPGLLPPVNVTEIAECWSSLENVQAALQRSINHLPAARLVASALLVARQSPKSATSAGLRCALLIHSFLHCLRSLAPHTMGFQHQL